MTAILPRMIPCLLLLACSLSAHAIRIYEIPDTRMDLLEPDFMTTGFEGATGQVNGSESVFTDIGLSKVSLGSYPFTGSSPRIVPNIDTLNTDVVGNTLVAQGGRLAIAAPGERFDLIQAFSGFLFEVDGRATQLGFRIVDQPGLYVDLLVFLNGTVVGSSLINPTGTGTGSSRYFLTNTAFDAFAIMATDTVPVGGWGVDDIGLGGKVPAPVPSPGTLWLVGVGILVLISPLGWTKYLVLRTLRKPDTMTLEQAST